MRPLFSIHAGEYLVGNYLETHFKDLRIWIPSRDTGIDILATDKSNQKTISIQVKFSKNFLIDHTTAHFHKDLSALGWWSINAEKLKKSEADLWVFVLLDMFKSETHFVVIPPADIYNFFAKLHGKKKIWQTYITLTKSNKCWDIRALPKSDQVLVAKDKYVDSKRDLTQWLNNWDTISQLA